MRSIHSLHKHDDVIEAEVIPMTAMPAPLPPPLPHVQPSHTWADVAWRVMEMLGNGLAALGWLLGVVIPVGWKFTKLGICVGLDIMDFFIGRLLGFGILFDLGCALITAALWGHRGWWCLWEVIDITEQLDGFIPTCSIIALRSWNDN